MQRLIFSLYLWTVLNLLAAAQEIPVRPADARFGVLTLNLHTWQEEDAVGKLERVADLIARLNIEIVVLQECGQNQDAEPGQTPAAPFQTPEDTLFLHEVGGLEGNAAWLIQERLEKVHGLSFQFYWSWAHIGFGEYQEGSAVLSRWPLHAAGREVVSAATSRHDISRRQIVYADVTDPEDRPLRIVSAHLGWGADQVPQIQKTHDVLSGPGAPPAILAGDFNMEPSQAGYRLLSDLGWKDAWTASLQRRTPSATMGGRRIDYVWLAENVTWQPVFSQTVFKSNDQGPMAQVSDHAGVLVWFSSPTRPDSAR